MKPSGSVRMNQYAALCPQAFEYLIPGKLQRAATGSHANMKPKTHAATTNRAIRNVFKRRDQDVQKYRNKLHIQTSRGTYPCRLQLTSESERRLCADQYRCPRACFWPVSDRRRRRPALILPKPRSVRPFLERHPPQYQDIGRCSRVWYGRGVTVQPSDSLSVGKSVWPSSAVAYGYHSLKGPIPTEEPRNPRSGHTDELTGAVMRGSDWGKDSPLLSV